MANELFPQRPKKHPFIYAYEDNNPNHKGFLKVGYTERDVETRVAEQFPVIAPDGKKPYRIVLRESAMYPDGTNFMDHDVHRVLKRNKDVVDLAGEWFKCTVDQVKAAILAVREHTENTENRTQNFKMRPEQQAAVEKTSAYFYKSEEDNARRCPKFLWNCKMRFGKTFAAYQLAKKMQFKRILILTFKPAVISAWHEDLTSHLDFEGWQFISRDTELTYENADKNRSIVCFGSFQDFLGVDRKTGGIKPKNEWVHTVNWDLVIFDEYHFGAWKENAKKLFEDADDDVFDNEDIEHYDRGNACDETWLPIMTRFYLFLSGTPFRALNSGEFIEEQIYNWTYTDEQSAKENWQGANNPYAALPRMVLMTYRIPDSIRNIAMQGEFNEFDLNVFFAAKGKDENARFIHEEYVQRWLDLIRGAYMETTLDDLKLGAKKPALPYADVRLLNILQHTLWFLPNVASCYAMANLLAQRKNTFFHDYTINVCAGTKAGIGAAALKPVLKSMRDPLESKTITLSCGKLTTGVTVKPWTGIFMLRNLSSPETYFQAAFRVQSPWEISTEDGGKEIIKKECYVFDFALDRALKQISDYSCQLNINESNPEKKVDEFIKFLPVIAYDGSTMQRISAREILDNAMTGTSSTLLAKGWESALLVNVDNDTLQRLLTTPAAIEALMKIEGFRSLNKDIETIINKSDAVKKAKKENNDNLTPKEKKQLTEDEKEFKSKRKQIQEKLIKFATRIPVFMYLTDFREYSLRDVITQLEPELFKKVTGLGVNDFELLVSLGVFNNALMNRAVYNFKRYEDASLEYTGINRHEGENYGGWDTVITKEEFDKMAGQQFISMDEPVSAIGEIPSARKFETPDAAATEPLLPKTDTTLSVKPAPKQTATAKQAAGTSSTAVKSTPSATAQTGAAANGSTNVWRQASNPYSLAAMQFKKANDHKPEPLNIDTSDIKPGVNVAHKAFGSGVVVNVDANRITVSFDGIEKRFPFPGAFLYGFLQKL